MAHLDPIADAAAYYEPRFKAAEAQAKAEREADDAFMAACGRCDANALADFAPMTTDWVAARIMKCRLNDVLPKCKQTLAEVMTEAFDYRNGPSMAEAMQLLLNVAYGTDLEAAQDQAKRLIERMAKTWAAHNTAVED